MQQRRRALHAAVAMSAAMLVLSACATAEPAGPTSPAAPSSGEPSAPAGTASPAPTASPEPLAGWQTVETSDGLFRWSIPADWTVVDESFEAEHDLGHVNAITVLSDIGQELAYFGSAYYGDRGGACGDGTTDGTVPIRIHLDEPAALEPARIIALTREISGHLEFVAGYTLDDIQAHGPDRMWCHLYHDVAVPDEYPMTSFSTTFDDSLWTVESFEAGAAYTETQEYDELMDMFRSLELLDAP